MWSREYLTILEKYPTGSDLIQRHIQPDNHVLVVGPGLLDGVNGYSLPMDVGGVFGVGYKLAGGIGKLTILGLSSQDGKEYCGGCNNIPELQRSLKEISRVVSLCPIRYVESPILKFNPEGGGFDTVWDHLTFFGYIINSQDSIDGALKHYLALLKPGGKLLLFYSRFSLFVNEVINEVKSAADALLCGVSCENIILIDDVYDVPQELVTYIRKNNAKLTGSNGTTLLLHYKADGILCIYRKSSDPGSL